jgi:hypothetical protein
MRIRYQLPTAKAACPEVDPADNGSPVQVIFYDGEEPLVVEGSAQTFPDGLTVIQLPIVQAPSPGTPVQIIIYPPGADPTVIEGTTIDSGDPLVIGLALAPMAAE